jgi:hypothetical protein
LAPAALPVSVREPAKQLSQYDEASEAWYLLDGHFAQTVCSGTPWYSTGLDVMIILFVDDGGAMADKLNDLASSRSFWDGLTKTLHTKVELLY